MLDMIEYEKEAQASTTDLATHVLGVISPRKCFVQYNTQIVNNYWTRLSKIIDLRDTDKSRYFAITEFNNCFISRSPSLFSYFNHFLTAQGSDLPFFSRERGSNYA